MNSLIKIFANQTLVETLNLFLLNPDEEFYQFDISKRIKKALMQVQRVLKTLQEVGLISSIKHGRMVYYRAVRTHPAFEDLKHLFLKTISLGETVRLALQPFHDSIYLTFIFGSVAKDTESLESDIDLFIISDISLRELSQVLTPLSHALKRELNPIIYKREDFKKKLLARDHFLTRIIKEPKLWIIGNEDNLKQLVKRGKT
ncbi:MAG TPA: nucleotidyltransferase domain-containing protein [Chlamydiales bacterium]|nr:nucleotidyltransferase domain-containing protein [Chlamydiales bacterium]